MGFPRITARFVGIAGCRHRRIGGPRGDCVAPDAVRPPFDAHLPYHHQQCRLAGRIEAERRGWLRRRHGGGGYESALACFQMGMGRSEEHTSELQSLMRISYAVFCLKKKKRTQNMTTHHNTNLLKPTQ